MVFTLRDWKTKDASAFQKYANNQKIAQYMSDGFPYPYTLQDAEELIENFISADREKQLNKAIIVNGEVAGSIGVFKKDGLERYSAEIGYWLGEPFWGNGIMGKAVKEIAKESFQTLKIVRIEAKIFAHNTANQRTLEKAGFTLEGILKKSFCKYNTIYDSKLFALTDEGMI